jgi:hypothetical protein
MGVQLGVWRFIPSHSFALSRVWNVIPELPFWSAPLQALALVASPRLGLQHYTWEFLKERIELEFNPKNSHYISRCKLHDLVNVTNDNLRQYVRAYSELMLEIQHMHKLDHCAILWWGYQLGPSASLKRIDMFHYPRPSWKWKVFWMWDGVKSSGSKRITCRNLNLVKCGGEAQHLEKWGFGVPRDSRMFRARQQGAKHLALRCSWCHWNGLET